MEPNKSAPTPAEAFIRAITAYGTATERCDVEQAESAAMVMAEASAGFAQPFQADLKLGQLFLRLERLGPAGECAAAASAAARRSGMSTLQVLALETQALCALRRSALGPVARPYTGVHHQTVLGIQ